jgi:hypothetical protein
MGSIEEGRGGPGLCVLHDGFMRGVGVGMTGRLDVQPCEMLYLPL